ncbi:MAG: hypothetical protein ACREHE_09585 [Rhizomicrobium sp.]
MTNFFENPFVLGLGFVASLITILTWLKDHSYAIKTMALAAHAASVALISIALGWFSFGVTWVMYAAYLLGAMATEYWVNIAVAASAIIGALIGSRLFARLRRQKGA